MGLSGTGSRHEGGIVSNSLFRNFARLCS